MIVYCHGGGYTLGSPETALPITERLAVAADIVSVDYRLAPEHPYPAGPDDCRAVWDAVAALVAPVRPLVLAGDSAGANMALTVAIACRRSGDPMPVGLALFSPHVDHVPLATDGPPERAWLSAAYRSGADPADPGVSPLWADPTGLPPLYLQAGTDDFALGDAARLARRARLAGVEVDLDVWPRMWHTWQYHRDLPEADRALADARAVIRRWSSPAGG